MELNPGAQTLIHSEIIHSVVEHGRKTNGRVQRFRHAADPSVAPV